MCILGSINETLNITKHNLSDLKLMQAGSDVILKNAVIYELHVHVQHVGY